MKSGARKVGHKVGVKSGEKRKVGQKSGAKRKKGQEKWGDKSGA